MNRTSLRLQFKRVLGRSMPPRRDRSCVLVYHSVGAGWKNSITLADFKDQIALLEESHNIIPLADLIGQTASGTKSLAALTFDDGYEDNFEIFRLLQAKGLPFTLFLCTAFLDSGVCNWGTRFRSLRSLTWAQAGEMAQAGVELGSHMHNHRRWINCSDDELKEEINRSTRLIGDRCGQVVRFFAYPYGQCDARCSRILAEQGIQAGLTGTHKTFREIEDRFQIPRLSINAEDSLTDFKQSIFGQRDLLAAASSARRLFS